jgi:hypothetical protein
MKRRYVLSALAVVGVLAVVSPALGGPSLRKLVKKEVAKQLAGKTGPAGANGINGANGTPGANGTARAYAEILPRGSGGCNGVMTPPQPCSFDRDKGISSVTYLATGEYCVVAAGINSADVTPAVSVDFSETNNPEGNASVQNNTQCNGTGFDVRTERITSGTAAPDDNVGFDIVIP